MGIKAPIIKKDVPAISPKSVIPFDSKYSPQHDAVVMYDLTFGLYKLTKPAAERAQRTQMTGTEFRDAFNQRIRNLARWKRTVFAKLVIVCLDKKKFVPKAKARTQTKRTEKSNVEKYADGCTFCQDGIILPGGKVEMIDIMRLAASSNMRETLATFLCDGLDDTGVPIMMDCWEKPRFGGEPLKEPITASNCIGEADLQLMFWAHHFRDDPIIHITVDGDEIPIAMGHMRAHGPPAKDWHWIQHWASTPEKDKVVIDLVQLYRDLTVHSFYGEKALYKSHVLDQRDRANMFLLYTMMFGTDFTAFTKWTNYVQHTYVWIGMHLAIKEIRRMLELWDRSQFKGEWLPHDEEVEWLPLSMTLMEVVLRHIFTAWANQNVKPHFHEGDLPEMRSIVLFPKMQGTNSPVFPDKEQLMQAVRELRFNFMYWTNVIESSSREASDDNTRGQKRGLESIEQSSNKKMKLEDYFTEVDDDPMQAKGQKRGLESTDQTSHKKMKLQDYDFIEIDS